MSIRVIEHPSTNFDTRDPDIPLKYIVLHYTGMPTRDAALQRLCDPAAKVSAHYLIDEDGTTYRLVDEADRAWHAGRSYWKGISDINSASIGIELVNPGHEFGYRPFATEQIKGLKILLNDIIARHLLDRRNCLLGHSDIAPLRKTDPGELFPWEELASDGLGYWPKESEIKVLAVSAAELLKQIGYQTLNDATLPLSLLAFQRRYCPNNLSSLPDPLTMTKLFEVARLQNEC